MKSIHYIYFLVFLSISCQQEGLIETNDEVVFSFEGLVSGSELILEAGNDEYFMHTDWFSDGEEGTYLIGDLKPTNSVKEGIRFEITNGATFVNNFNSINKLDLYQANNVAVGMRLIPQISGDLNGIELEWSFNDEALEDVGFFPVVPIDELLEGDWINVSLDYHVPELLEGNLETQVSANQFFGGILNLNKLNEDAIRLSLVPVGVSGPDITWENGETGIGVIRPNDLFDFSASMEDDDIQGASASVRGSLLSTDFNKIQLGFIPQFPAAESITEDQEGIPQIKIEYTDRNGKRYLSSLIDQKDEAEFSIIRVEPYLINENGQNTLLIEAIFSIRLLAKDRSEFILINDARVVFAVAMP